MPIASPRECYDKLTTSALYALQFAGFPFAVLIALLSGLESQIVTVSYRCVYLSLAGLIIIHHGFIRKRFCISPKLIPFLLLWLCLLIRLIHDLPEMPYILSYTKERFLFYVIGTVMIPTLAFAVIPSHQAFDTAGNTLFYCLLLAAAGIGYSSWGSNATTATGRLSNAILNPISVGHLGTSLILISGTTLFTTGIWKLRSVISYGSALLIGIFLVLASESRGPEVALVVAALCYVLLTPGRKAIAITVVLMTSMLGVGFYVKDYIEANSSVKVFGRWQDLDDIDISKTSSGSRKLVVTLAWEQFLSSPVSGDFVVERTSGYYPHNIVVETLMATGVCGGVLLTLIIALSTARAFKIIRRFPSLAWLSLLYIQYLVNAMLSGSIYLDSAYWGLSIAVIVGESVYRGSGHRLRVFYSKGTHSRPN